MTYHYFLIWDIEKKVSDREWKTGCACVYVCVCVCCSQLLSFTWHHFFEFSEGWHDMILLRTSLKFFFRNFFKVCFLRIKRTNCIQKEICVVRYLSSLNCKKKFCFSFSSLCSVMPFFCWEEDLSFWIDFDLLSIWSQFCFSVKNKIKINWHFFASCNFQLFFWLTSICLFSVQLRTLFQPSTFKYLQKTIFKTNLSLNRYCNCNGEIPA